MRSHHGYFCSLRKGKSLEVQPPSSPSNTQHLPHAGSWPKPLESFFLSIRQWAKCYNKSRFLLPRAATALSPQSFPFGHRLHHPHSQPRPHPAQNHWNLFGQLPIFREASRGQGLNGHLLLCLWVWQLQPQQILGCGEASGLEGAVKRKLGAPPAGKYLVGACESPTSLPHTPSSRRTLISK